MGYISSTLLGTITWDHTPSTYTETLTGYCYNVTYNIYPCIPYMPSGYNIKTKRPITLSNQSPVTVTRRIMFRLYANRHVTFVYLIPDDFEIPDNQKLGFDPTEVWTRYVIPGTSDYDFVFNGSDEQMSKIIGVYAAPYWYGDYKLYYVDKNAVQVQITTGSLAQNSQTTIPITAYDADTLKTFDLIASESSNPDITTSAKSYVTNVSAQYGSDVCLCKALAPTKTMDNTTPIMFAWSHISERGVSAFGYDLQYSYNQADWINLNNISPVDNTAPVLSEYTAEANVFDIGIVYWRIRTYNSLDEPTDWAQSAFIAASVPGVPTITSCSTTPSPVLTWVSQAQVAYQVVAGNYDSGPIYGTAQNYKIPAYFADGTLIVQLRYKNRTREWSDWASITVNIVNSPPSGINLAVELSGTNAVLSFTVSEDLTNYFVIRDGNPVAKISNSPYTDYTACGDCIYQIMGVNLGGNYALSNEVPVKLYPDSATISIIGQKPIVLNKRRGGTPEIQTKKREDISYQYYSGRRLPLAYSARATTREKSLSYTVYKDDADKIMDMVGEVVIYKDYAGNKIIGMLNDAETSGRATRPDITLTITEIDYSEVIPYD